MLTRRIPELPKSRNGKPFLDWEQGMPLHKFLALVCRKDSESPLKNLEGRIKKVEKNLADNHVRDNLDVIDMELR